MGGISSPLPKHSGKVPPELLVRSLITAMSLTLTHTADSMNFGPLILKGYLQWSVCVCKMLSLILNQWGNCSNRAHLHILQGNHVVSSSPLHVPLLQY